MSIRSVSQKQFEAFGPPSVDSRITEQLEWFADDENVVIGVITRDRSDPDWSFELLGRDRHGVFRVFSAETAFKTQDDARRQLFAKMEMALATGARTFPQSD